jgi:hypothetical protein
MNAVSLLPDSVAIPADISRLVQDAYDDGGVDVCETLTDSYASAKNEYDFIVNDKESRARAFRINDAAGGYDENMVGWIDATRKDTNDKQAEASVRDTEDSLEVIVLWRDSGGRLRLLPWIEKIAGVKEYELDQYYTPDESVARALAFCTVNLPLHKDWQIDRAIKELESEGFSAWQDSYWLEGELFLILNESMHCELIGYEVRYTWEKGLKMNYKKKGGRQ